jgi:hypothetical protein
MTLQLSSWRTSFLRLFIMDTEAEKSVSLWQKENQIHEREKANFAGLN